MAAKVAGSWNLHRETERLDSISCLFIGGVRSGRQDRPITPPPAFEDALLTIDVHAYSGAQRQWGGWSESGATELDGRFIRR